MDLRAERAMVFAVHAAKGSLSLLAAEGLCMSTVGWRCLTACKGQVFTEKATLAIDSQKNFHKRERK